MRPERGALQGDVGVDVEHAAVVVAHEAKAVLRHPGGDARGLDPGVDLAPAHRIVVEHAGDLVEAHAGALEDVGDLGHRAGGAVRQPLARHPRAVAQAVERGVVDRRLGGEVEDDHRHLRALHHRQHGGRQRVGSDVEEQQVDLAAAALAARLAGAVGVVDQAEVDDLDARPGELRRDAGHVALEALLQAGELRPVGVQSDPEQSEAQRRRIHTGR